MSATPWKRALHAISSALSRRLGFIEVTRTRDLESDLTFKMLYRTCQLYTMTSISRMYALYQAVSYVSQHRIPGDIVECGVWRGGSSMLAASTLMSQGETERRLYLYDTFEGMSEPTERDADFRNRSARSLLESSPRNAHVWGVASLEDVQRNMALTRYPNERLVFVRGKVEDTIPDVIPAKIAVLRLDTDWFESTYHELVHLFPRLVANGVLIIDDYGYWKGARAAVDRYLQEQQVIMLLHRIDFTGRIGVKLGPLSPVDAP